LHGRHANENDVNENPLTYFLPPFPLKLHRL
jgi:hypothetical protein